MIWVKFEKSEPFIALNNKLVSVIRKITPVDAKRKEPIPHITIARFHPSKVKSQELVIPTTPAELQARQIELWQTNFHKDGVQYEVLSHFELSARDANSDSRRL